MDTEQFSNKVRSCAPHHLKNITSIKHLTGSSRSASVKLFCSYQRLWTRLLPPLDTTLSSLFLSGTIWFHNFLFSVAPLFSPVAAASNNHNITCQICALMKSDMSANLRPCRSHRTVRRSESQTLLISFWCNAGCWGQGVNFEMKTEISCCESKLTVLWKQEVFLAVPCSRCLLSGSMRKFLDCCRAVNPCMALVKVSNQK